jgi:hypothetical protein
MCRQRRSCAIFRHDHPADAERHAHDHAFSHAQRQWLPGDGDVLGRRFDEFGGNLSDELLLGRVQIINIWRPIHGPLRDYPLAVADARSVSVDDLVPSDLVYRHRVGDTYNVTHNPDHGWFYLSEMQPQQPLLLKCYDSLGDGRARFAPHTAFADPTAPPDSPLRESVELRTLVFHRPG